MDLEQWLYDTCNKVLRILGHGYPERIYHNALLVELRKKGISYESERIVPITYDTNVIGHGRADVIIDKKLILEFKCHIKPKEDSVTQILHYMKQLCIPDGIIINFGTGKRKQYSVDFITLKNYKIISSLFQNDKTVESHTMCSIMDAGRSKTCGTGVRVER